MRKPWFRLTQNSLDFAALQWSFYSDFRKVASQSFLAIDVSREK